MPKQITSEWINQKVGELYISNLQLVETVNELIIQNNDLKNELATIKASKEVPVNEL